MVQNIPENMKSAFERTAHPYYFYDSLMSTPEGLKKILEPTAFHAIKASAEVVKNKKLVYFVGNGTSYYNAVATPYMMNLHTTVLSNTFTAYEFLYYPPNKLDEECCVVGISHSGNSLEAVNALEFARSKGATTIAITDYIDAKMCKFADIVITSENDEKQGPKNRSYVASLLRTHLLSLECSRLEGKNIADVMKQYQNSPRIAEKILAENEQIVKGFAEAQAQEDIQRVIICGSGFQYSGALEGALKFTEAALVYSEAWELEEGVHGLWYSMKPSELLIVNAIKGSTYEKSKLLVKGFRDIVKTIWVITNTSDVFSDADFITRLPEGLTESIYALYTIVPIYLFVYFYALALGKNHLDHGPYDNQKFMDARWILRSL